MASFAESRSVAFWETPPVLMNTWLRSNAHRQEQNTTASLRRVSGKLKGWGRRHSQHARHCCRAAGIGAGGRQHAHLPQTTWQLAQTAQARASIMPALSTFACGRDWKAHPLSVLRLGCWVSAAVAPALLQAAIVTASVRAMLRRESAMVDALWKRVASYSNLGLDSVSWYWFYF